MTKKIYMERIRNAQTKQELILLEKQMETDDEIASYLDVIYITSAIERRMAVLDDVLKGVSAYASPFCTASMLQDLREYLTKIENKKT